MSSQLQKSKKDSLTITLESVLDKVEKIFQFYCQFGERLNTKTLKSFKYIRLLEDSKILVNSKNILSNNPLSKHELEIIFYSESKNNNTINFHQFLNILVRISNIKYSFEDKKRNTLQLIIEYLMPLYNKIFNRKTLNNNNSTIIKEKNIEDFIHENNIILIIQKISKVLFDIYKIYFQHEISASQEMKFVISESEKKLFDFGKNFDISPGLISKSSLLSLYQSEVNNTEVDKIIRKEKDFYLNLIKNINLDRLIKFEKKNLNILGNHFNFFKFIRLLLKISDFSYNQLNINTKEAERYNNQIKNFESKFIMFLKKIELSKGFSDIPKETYKNQNKDNMILSYYIENEKKNNTYNEFINNINSSCLFKTLSSSLIKDKDNDIIIGRSFNPNDDFNEENLINYHNNFLDLVKFTDYIKENYGDNLKKIFTGLCKYGNTDNNKVMKNSSFHYMLTYCQLIKSENTILFYEENKNDFLKPDYLLSKNEVDDIFIKLANLPFEENINSDIRLKNLNIKNTNNESSIENKLNDSQIKNNYITFEGFIICQEILARICFKKYNIKDAIDVLINQNIFQGTSKFIHSYIEFQKKIEKILIFEEKGRDFEIINDLKNSLKPIFNYYTNKSNKMNFNQLLNFAKEFEIFPSLLNYFYLNEYFYHLSLSLKKKNSDENYIDFDKFIDLICLIAFDLKMNNLEDLGERLYFLMDKFTLAQNKFKVNQLIKEKFPERYQIKKKEEDNDFFKVFYQ